MPDILHTISAGWRPAVEIAILTIGIYYSFNFVRGTRGAPVVYGFMLLVLSLTVVASFLLRLEVLSWLLAVIRRLRCRGGADHFPTGAAPDSGGIGNASLFNIEPRAKGKYRGHRPDCRASGRGAASAP